MLVRQLDLSNWQQQVFRPHHCPTHLNSTLVKLFSRTSLQIMSLSQKILSVNKIIHSIQIQYIFIHWIIIWIIFSIVDILVKPMQLKSFLRYILCAFDRGCYWHLELRQFRSKLAHLALQQWHAIIKCPCQHFMWIWQQSNEWGSGHFWVSLHLQSFWKLNAYYSLYLASNWPNYQVI